MKFILLSALISFQVLASGYFEMRGTVTSFDAERVILSTQGGLVRVKRSSLGRQTLRPGKEVSVLVTKETQLEVLDGPITRREPSRKN